MSIPRDQGPGSTLFSEWTGLHVKALRMGASMSIAELSALCEVGITLVNFWEVKLYTEPIAEDYWPVLLNVFRGLHYMDQIRASQFLFALQELLQLVETGGELKQQVCG